MGFNKAKKSLNKLMDTYERRLRGRDTPGAALDEFIQQRE
tara:strand:+ start:504 stop:623 length:120 start_codon:yes stop_codon:yes gene_type:complete